MRWYECERVGHRQRSRAHHRVFAPHSPLCRGRECVVQRWFLGCEVRAVGDSPCSNFAHFSVCFFCGSVCMPFVVCLMPFCRSSRVCTCRVCMLYHSVVRPITRKLHCRHCVAGYCVSVGCCCSEEGRSSCVLPLSFTVLAVGFTLHVQWWVHKPPAVWLVHCTSIGMVEV